MIEILFLFDCVGGFGGDVVGYLVDFFDFVYDLGCGFIKEFVIEGIIVCCYVVDWSYGL